MWKFLSPFTCRTMRDFSSRSAGRGQCHRGMRSETRHPLGWVNQYSQLLMTPPRGSPLKSNSTSMYLPWEQARVRTEGRQGVRQPRSHVHSPTPCCAPAPSGSPWPWQGLAPGNSAPPSLFPGHSRIGKSCRCGWSWHFQRLRGEDGVTPWAGGAVPTPGTGTGSGAHTLQHGVGLQELLLHLVHFLPFAAHSRHVGHHQLAGLCGRGAMGAGAMAARPTSPSQPCSAQRQPQLYLFCRPRSRQ